MRKILRNALCCSLLFLLFPSLLLAEDGDVIQTAGEGWVNWSEGTAFARGEGFPPQNARGEQQARTMALRAAVVVAQRNLLEITKEVRIDSETVVKDMMVESDVIRSRVEGFVKGAQVYERHCRPDNSCDVLMGMKLSGQFLNSVIPQDRFSSLPLASPKVAGLLKNPGSLLGMLSEMLVPSAHAASLRNRYSKEEVGTLRKVIDDAGNAADKNALIQGLKGTVADLENIENFTGILIDASAAPEFNLAVNPVIKNPDGVEVYPANFVSYENAVRLRPVTYKLSIDGAVNDKRVFNVPFQAKALGVYKKKLSDLVVSQGDADKIQQLGKNTTLLENCKVVVVVAQ